MFDKGCNVQFAVRLCTMISVNALRENNLKDVTSCLLMLMNIKIDICALM